jgi:transposase-like protein
MGCAARTALLSCAAKRDETDQARVRGTIAQSNAQSLYYTWSKEFMEAGKRRLAGDTARAANTGEVQDLRREARALKECVADLTLENRLLKKSMIGDGEDDA